MIIVMFVLLMAFIITFNLFLNMESHYLGENSSLKLALKRKEKEIDDLKREINRLKTYQNYEPEI